MSPDAVRLVEVGPRDGLQNEARVVPWPARVALIDALSQAGLPVIEAGAFVAPRWVPQMADSAAVLAAIHRRAGVRYPVLVPNLKGLKAATSGGVDDIAVFAAASETFSKKNINCSIAESLERLAEVAARAKDRGIAVRGYVSCVLGCPYEGAVAIDRVVEVAAALAAMGCHEISLGDTIGVGTPRRAREMVQAVAGAVPVQRLAAHFHDTYGQALANILAVLEIGVTTFDCSVAGLGGCPYAPGASGNVATEDVVYMLDGMGIASGVDLEKLRLAGLALCQTLGRPPASRAARALAARKGRGG
uniref:hydroxymethylglutaryl-CoA lyase n=1 Tax=Rhodospirillum rubrum TaxID=1085 RepID=P95639_RHORU|nr:3-hydroxy-3-methylglutaryl-CoA lyase [Rhodospirillum rubrum ATCC 11170]